MVAMMLFGMEKERSTDGGSVCDMLTMMLFGL